MADDTTLPLIVFHLEDEVGNPLADVTAASTGGPGPWTRGSNRCGDIFTNLTPADDYVITFTKAGYETLVLPAVLKDCGIISQTMKKGGGGPPPVKPGVLPPIPTRAQVCALQTSLAGLTYHTAEFGDIPAWFYGALDNDDRVRARDSHHAAGDTHVTLPVTEAYREGGTLWPAELANGYDLTEDMDAYRVLAFELIADGFLIDCPLGGDGLGSGPGYNDVVGRTYGNQWLVQGNLERMLRALIGDGTKARPDLTPYMIFRPGWDAIFYSWGDPAAATASVHGLRWRWTRLRDAKPTPLTVKQLDEQQMRVRDFGLLFRQILPNGYLAIEHGPGTIPCGEGGGDYAPGGLMQTYDTILSEFDTFHEDSFWQIAGRMLEHYVRPSDQPAGDDPHPPWYLAPGSPRGPYFWSAFEPTKHGVYEWCRGRTTREAMQQEDAYIRACGVTLTGYPLHW